MKREKFYKFTPVKQNFEPVKKSEKTAREKKSEREKTPKSGRETVFFNFFARENNSKKCQKWLSRALLSFAWEKKKHCGLFSIFYSREQSQYRGSL